MSERFEQIVETKTLYAAWRKVRANRGAAGVDEVSWFGFEQTLDANLAELSRNLKSGTYNPLPAKFVEIAKRNGKTRELGILTIRDRVAQRAVLDVIEPMFEAEMEECNYAFRSGRNVEMAVQRVLLHRAGGNWWTVESDIQNYFAEIDCRILLAQIREKIADEKIVDLIELWLNAGILRETSAEAEKNWWQIAQINMAHLTDAFGETIKNNLDEFISAKLGLSPFETDYLQMNPEVEELLAAPEAEDFQAKIREEMKAAKTSAKREALKKVLESGLIYALSHRAMLAKMLGFKILGVGGLLLAGGLFAPKVYEKAKDYFRVRKGVLQGSPVSPLLANVYLTPFDKKLTKHDFRLVRYCDDFVILCRSREEAEAALEFARLELGRRNLALHPEKTRIIPPDGEFDFLGYHFTKNGNVEPPPSVPEKIAKQIRQAAFKAKAKRNAAKAADETGENKSRFAVWHSWETILKALNRKKN